MKPFILRHHRVLFYAVWFLLNIIQASTTELFDDEAYYWIYSLFPAWGYFDHPPAIAILIKLGTLLFDGELGVRFFIVLLNTGSLFLIEKLIEKKDHWLFYAIAGSLAVAQIGGIIAVPDLPLMFFVALFFLVYKRFIGDLTFANAILLGCSIALMLYSKYHGVLIVLFTVCSNLKLLRHYQTYIAAAIAAVFFLPHLIWQFQHDLPSVQYHLFERNASAYKFAYTTEYIGGQIALAGPVIGWLLLYAAFRRKPASDTERALKFSLVGLYLFFMLSTIKGRVEANWTVPAFVALIVLSHQFLFHKQRLRKWLYWSLPVTLLLVFAGRIFMMADQEPAKWLSKDEFHGNKTWTAELKTVAGDLPVVFINTYQRPSKYWFYTGGVSMSMNTANYRRNNFNFWPVEDSLIGKPVYAMGTLGSFFDTPFKTPYLVEYGGKRIENYYSFSKVQIRDISVGHTRDSIRINAEIVSPGNYLPLFQQAAMSDSEIYFTILTPGKRAEYVSTGFTVDEITSEKQNIVLTVAKMELNQESLYKLSISSCIPGEPSLNSTSFKLD